MTGREVLGEVPQTQYETPLKAVALTPVAPLRRMESDLLASAVAPLTRCKSPQEEAVLLRTISTVMKEHITTIQRASSAEERQAAATAAAADLETLQKQLLAPEEVDPGCAVPRRLFPENAVLRRDIAAFFSELTDMVAPTDAAAMKASLYAWASDAMESTSNSIARALEAAAPIITLAKAAVSDTVLLDVQASMGAPIAEETVAVVQEAEVTMGEPAPLSVSELPTATLEPVMPTDVPAPVMVQQRGGGVVRFIRRLLMLTVLGAGAAVAVQNRAVIMEEVNKRVAQIQSMRKVKPMCSADVAAAVDAPREGAEPAVSGIALPAAESVPAPVTAATA